MSKLLNYLGILATILIGAHILGLIENTGTSVILSWMANPESLNVSTFFASLINLFTFASIGTGAVAVGLLVSGRGDLAIKVGLASLLVLVGWDILGIYSAIKLINADFALLLISPILLIYFLTIIEWWEGTG